MDTIALPTVESPQPQKQQKTNGLKNPTGFQLHPEHINKTGLNRKEWTVRQMLLDAGEELVEIKNKYGNVIYTVKIKELTMKNLWRKASKGDVQAAREVFDRIEGKVDQKHNVDLNGEITISFHKSLEQHGA